MKKERRYKIDTGDAEHEIICAEYMDGAGGNVIAIPYYHVPGRKYANWIHLYAISLYSSNPKMGQRAAAKATKELFGLKTYSHTTLGRALKSLAASINADGESGGSGSGAREGGEAKAGPEPEAGSGRTEDKKHKFPSVDGTADQRAKAAAVLGGLCKAGDKNDIKKAVREIVKHWYSKHRRLLFVTHQRHALDSFLERGWCNAEQKERRAHNKRTPD